MQALTRAVALGAALLLLAAPGAARACKLADDYRAPSNLELAAGANTIVLGEVIGAAEAVRAPGEARSSAIEVRPMATLKGLAPGESLILPGMALAPPGTPAETAAAAIDFAEPHPEARAGACIRRSFPAGATVLFFLRRDDGAWLPAGGPLSRWAEDVAGPDDPWVQLARLYVQAASVMPEERQALLEDQLEALQARIDAEASLPRARSGDDPATLAFATDIERTIAAPGFPLVAERPPEPVLAPAEQDADLGAVGAGIDALAGDAGDR